MVPMSFRDTYNPESSMLNAPAGEEWIGKKWTDCVHSLVIFLPTFIMLNEPVLKNTYLKLSNLLTLWVNFYIASTADYLCLDVDPPKAVGNIVCGDVYDLLWGRWSENKLFFLYLWCYIRRRFIISFIYLSTKILNVWLF